MVNKIQQAIDLACKNYGIELVYTKEIGYPLNDGWHGSPNGYEALSHIDMKIMVETTRMSDDPRHTDMFPVIHEIEHLVWWHPTLGVEAPEWLMMPLGVALLREVGLPAHAYMEHPYTAFTIIPRKTCEIGKAVERWKHPTRSAWYRRAVDASVKSGVLSDTLKPTWKFPDWSEIDVNDYAYLCK